eukprot:GFYU01014504.1.p1 GENE.GFYU01014504.1~~GFYU01014504.1.p1  ORF type:complete len:479 (-),score=58.15 GFYU01014504.1:119-1555(-)
MTHTGQIGGAIKKGIIGLIFIPPFANPHVEESFRALRASSALRDRRWLTFLALISSTGILITLDSSLIVDQKLFWVTYIFLLAVLVVVLLLWFLPFVTDAKHHARSDLLAAIAHVLVAVALTMIHFSFDGSRQNEDDYPYYPHSNSVAILTFAASIILRLPAKTVALNNVVITVVTAIATGFVVGKVGDALFAFLTIGSTSLSSTIAAGVAEKEVRHQFLLKLAVHNEMKMQAQEVDGVNNTSRLSMGASFRIQAEQGISEHMHRWTGRFKEPALEREYRISHAEKKMTFTRRISVFIIAQYIFMAILDVLGTSGTKHEHLLAQLLIVRFCVALPCMIACYCMTWWSRYPEFRSTYIIPGWSLVWAMADLYVGSLFATFSLQSLIYDLVLYRISITFCTILHIDYVAAMVVMFIVFAAESLSTVIRGTYVTGVFHLMVIGVSGLTKCREISFNSRYEMFMARQYADALSERRLRSLSL